MMDARYNRNGKGASNLARLNERKRIFFFSWKFELISKAVGFFWTIFPQKSIYTFSQCTAVKCPWFFTFCTMMCDEFTVRVLYWRFKIDLWITQNEKLIERRRYIFNVNQYRLCTSSSSKHSIILFIIYEFSEVWCWFFALIIIKGGVFAIVEIFFYR